MERAYEPLKIESVQYERWEKAGYFEPRGDGEAYTIILPPPNVTGTLHMGHAFQATLMDILIRHARMCGKCTLWQPGTDHAGIATQMVVERQLATENSSRAEVGRTAFVERVWRWRHESGGNIQRQFRRLGASLAWSRELFTLDEGPATAVAETFTQLYDAGLIYRGKRLVNWDPVLQTALSDLEVVNEEEDGSLWYIRYPFADRDGGLTVATTRPETLLGDVAVAVNPNDERFGRLVGQSLRLPLAGREIPIVADEHVDPEFGTGCVKVTPAHDFNDWAIGERHQLERINVLAADGSLLAEAEIYRPGTMSEPQALALPEGYAGLDRFEARKRMIADLQREGVLEKTEPHKLKVPRGDRSGAVLEPWLTDQWFVDLTREQRLDGQPGPGGLAAITRPAIEAVASGRTRFVPGNWSRTYFNWLENIQDWCISRQLWWGHQIPAWYDLDGGVHVGRDEADARKRSNLGENVELTRDDDVLDTWFSSALWPLTTLGWPRESAELERFYPTNVLVTGFDIIFFWVARMVMMGLYLAGDVPFHEVYVHGLIRDEHGQKMSKSKGNVLDPIDLIDGIDADTLVEKRTRGMMQPQLAERITRATRKSFPEGIAAYGTDALRFTFAALASPGRDINFDLGRIGGYRNFCNKLWNATRFVLMNVDSVPTAPTELSAADRWIRSRLGATLAAVDAHLADYRMDLAAQAVYEFTWSNFCDWYLELAKPALNAGGEAAGATRHTLISALEALLRMLHPIMPFITESLWQQVAPLAECSGDSIMLADWPVAADYARDENAEADITWLQHVIGGLRQLRSELSLAPGQRIPVDVYGANESTRARITRHSAAIAFLARTGKITLHAENVPDAVATSVVEEATLAVPLAGLVDTEAELARLDKTIARIETECERLNKKLGNEAFRAKAPPAVVAQEQAKLERAESELAHYREQRNQMATLEN
ncbi:MAG: valine--tRNA ligase [Gammaproteobacteria bacterium]